MGTLEDDHYATLQVTPLAEPEVVAAAYRALAKKYHPDRSSAPDAMQRMAQLNVAYQALRARTGSLPAAPSAAASEASSEAAAFFTHERVNPSASLEQVMAVVSRKVEAARQKLIDEVVRDGLPRDTAINLVRQTLNCSSPVGASAKSRRRGEPESRLRADTSYDEALQMVMAHAEIARNELADALVHDGLQRTTAVELVDSAFESIRRRPGNSASREARLTAEHLKQGASLEQSLQITTDKLRAALKLVIDELSRDGLPQQTAQQLCQAALEGIAATRRR